MVCGVYKIQCCKTNKVYIGKSKQVTGRWGSHISDLINESHNNVELSLDYCEYGIENFEFCILKLCDNKELDLFEHVFIEVYRKFYELYNMCHNYNVSNSDLEIVHRLITNYSKSLKKEFQVDNEKPPAQYYNEFKNLKKENKSLKYQLNNNIESNEKSKLLYEIETLQNKNKKLKDENTIIKNSDLDKNEIKRLNDLIEVYKKENKELYDNLEELEDDGYENEIEYLNGVITQLKQDQEKINEKYNSKISDLNNQLKSSKKVIEKLEKKTSSIPKKSKRLDRMIQIVEQENNIKSHEVLSDNINKENKINKLEEKNKQLNKTIKEQSDKICELECNNNYYGGCLEQVVNQKNQLMDSTKLIVGNVINDIIIDYNEQLNNLSFLSRLKKGFYLNINPEEYIRLTNKQIDENSKYYLQIQIEDIHKQLAEIGVLVDE